MNRVYQCFKNITVRQAVEIFTVILCLLIWAGLTCFVSVKQKGFSDQMAADRWSEENDTAQLSCFFSEDLQIDENRIREFQYHLDTLLKEASLAAETAHARLWVDAYSASGRLTLEGRKQTLEVQAVGVGGDFFFFHPLHLLEGAYFQGSDLMQDRIILDEDAAWKLFGSNDIVGMEVSIAGIPHYVAGVIRREDSYFHKAAGLKDTMVYVSYETLHSLGMTQGIHTYEMILPNPVRNFAYEKVREKFGIEESQMEMVENSNRFSVENLLGVAAEFGLRSMSFHGISYPYWENVARGWEDVFTLILILQTVALLVPAGICLIRLIAAWKHRTWTWKDVWEYLRLLSGRAAAIIRRQKEKIREKIKKDREKKQKL